MSTFKRFTTLASAQEYCDAQTALMDLPEDGVTQAWAQPLPLVDGSFVVPAYQDDDAQDWCEDWIISDPETDV
jgi:hypothetical protein